MDDQELKSLWQTDIIKKEGPDIDKLLHSKSIGILGKLQKTAKWEHYVNIIVSVLFVAFLLFQEKWWHSIGFAVFLTGIIVYYKKLYDKIIHITYTENVLEYLTDIYQTLKDFKKRYLIGMVVIFPISYALGFELGYDLGHELNSIEEANQEKNSLDSTTYDWFVFVAINIVTIALSAVFIHFIFQFFYGKHIKKIKGMIENLESIN